jgi:hypothetical protein
MFFPFTLYVYEWAPLIISLTGIPFLILALHNLYIGIKYDMNTKDTNVNENGYLKDYHYERFSDYITPAAWCFVTATMTYFYTIYIGL